MSTADPTNTSSENTEEKIYLDSILLRREVLLSGTQEAIKTERDITSRKGISFDNKTKELFEKLESSHHTSGQALEDLVRAREDALRNDASNVIGHKNRDADRLLKISSYNRSSQDKFPHAGARTNFDVGNIMQDPLSHTVQALELLALNSPIVQQDIADKKIQLICWYNQYDFPEFGIEYITDDKRTIYDLQKAKITFNKEGTFYLQHSDILAFGELFATNALEDKSDRRLIAIANEKGITPEKILKRSKKRFETDERDSENIPYAKMYHSTLSRTETIGAQSKVKELRRLDKIYSSPRTKISLVRSITAGNIKEGVSAHVQDLLALNPKKEDLEELAEHLVEGFSFAKKHFKAYMSSKDKEVKSIKRKVEEGEPLSSLEKQTLKNIGIEKERKEQQEKELMSSLYDTTVALLGHSNIDPVRQAELSLLAGYVGSYTHKGADKSDAFLKDAIDKVIAHPELPLKTRTKIFADAFSLRYQKQAHKASGIVGLRQEYVAALKKIEETDPSNVARFRERGFERVLEGVTVNQVVSEYDLSKQLKEQGSSLLKQGLRSVKLKDGAFATEDLARQELSKYYLEQGRLGLASLFAKGGTAQNPIEFTQQLYESHVKTEAPNRFVPSEFQRTRR